MTWPNHLPLTDDLSEMGGDYCSGIDAVINTVSVAHETAPDCSTNQKWEVAIDISMTVGLDPDAEFKIYIATDSAGTNFSFWKRSTSVNHVYSHSQLFGSDGSGSSTTEYVKARVEVVPKDRDEVCDGPVDSSQISRTEPLCTI